jgi:hypothetical protein
VQIAPHSNRLGFGLGWIVANAAGYAIALALWEVVSQPLWPALSGLFAGSITLALYGATLGLGAVLAQLLVLRLRRSIASWWVAATMLSLALGFVVGAWAAFFVSRDSLIDTITNQLYHANGRLAGIAFRETLADLVFGLLAGLTIGVARWSLLRAYALEKARRWIPVSAVAFWLGFGLADLMIQFVPPLPAAVYRLLFGACCGAIIGLIEWLWLRRHATLWPMAVEPTRASGATLSHRT